MKFIIYILITIIISLINIFIGIVIISALGLFDFSIISAAILFCSFILSIRFTKIMYKKVLLTLFYGPIIFYIIFKLSIIIIEFFNKFNPPC